MSEFDPTPLLAMLRDPNVESSQIAAATGAPREEAGRAARLLLTLSRAKAEEVATLPPPLALAVLHAAAQAGRVELVAALGAAKEKELAKEAKRLLHRLKLRGVAVPEPAPAPPPPPPPPEPPPPAYASTADARGERAIWLPRNVPGKGVEVAQVVCSAEKGLIELQLGLLGRKEWRGFVKGLLERGTAMGVTELPWSEAHALVVAARKVNETSGQRIPDGTDQWLGGLVPPPPAAV
jgi:hypothetical protein